MDAVATRPNWAEISSFIILIVVALIIVVIAIFVIFILIGINNIVHNLETITAELRDRLQSE